MIVALPCICFCNPEREIIKKYNFLTFPDFLDNFYVKSKTKKFSYFQKLLDELDGDIQYAVAPDGEYALMAELKQSYPDIVWLFPVHLISEVEIAADYGFEWLAMPHRRKWRDYETSEFISINGYKKWYLGFWAESLPHQLHFFDGFDTTLPETYSGKFGKLWLDWGKSVPSGGELPTIMIFEKNVSKFRDAIDKLDKLEATYQVGMDLTN